MAVYVKNIGSKTIVEYKFTLVVFLFLCVGIFFIALSPIFLFFHVLLALVFLVVGCFITVAGIKSLRNKEVLVVDKHARQISYKNNSINFSDIRKIYLRVLSVSGNTFMVDSPLRQIICEKINGDTVVLLPTDSNVDDKLKIIKLLEDLLSDVDIDVSLEENVIS